MIFDLSFIDILIIHVVLNAPRWFKDFSFMYKKIRLRFGMVNPINKHYKLNLPFPTQHEVLTLKKY